ncbi:LamG domain-containing protein [Candidatus Parvarchaeota archaeon]|nr:LamG domain-containing protein [Candidatus Parvarchaeota archaeon]
MSLTHRSQSALEYMMTYGWAILIIVIVAAVLYSFGIFSPSSSISATVTGFSNLGSVAAQCTANGVLRINLGDSTGYPINVTGITAKDSSTGQISTFKSNSTVDPNPIIDVGGSYIFSVPNVCPPAGTHYSISTTVNYTEPGQPLPGPYQSTGTISGITSSVILPLAVATFNGQPRWDGNPPITHVSGSTSYITSTAPSLTTNTDFNFTVSIWVYLDYYWVPPNSSAASSGWTPIFGFGYYQGGYSSNLPAYYGNPNGAFGSHTCTPGDQAINVNANEFNNTWNFVTFSRSYSFNRDTPGHLSYTYSIDGQVYGPYYLNYSDNDTNQIMIGSQFACDGRPFYGAISNVQIYNNPLSASQILSLYKEGILGGPLSGSGAIDWWPLNISTKDLVSGLVGTLNGPVQITSNFKS